MFLGQFEHSLDDKFRVTLPARFRGELALGVVITRGLDRSLWVFTRDKWDEVAAKIDSIPWTHKEGRSFARLMFSGAGDAVPDKQGRVRIPDHLLKYAGIESDIIVVGVNSRIELWDPDQWTDQLAIFEEDPDGLAAQLTDHGII